MNVMKTKIWQELKMGCPLRDGEVCKAKPDADLDFELCKYQKNCPFVYWFRIYESLIKYGRLV